MTSILHGVVINSRDYKETDRIYTLYTKERGKLQIMGKGTRKFESKLAAHMMPFARLQIMIAHGKVWPKLASVERMEDFPPMRASLQAYSLGLGLNELVSSAMQQDEADPQLYEFLISAYSWVQTLPELPALRLQFVHSALMLKWLVVIGFGPHCDACIGCRKDVSEVLDPALSTSHGGLVCASCVGRDRARFADSHKVTKEVIAALRFLATAPFETLLTTGFEPLLHELTEIHDEFTHYHIDRELKLPAFIQHITEYADNDRQPARTHRQRSLT